jgi:hypothetical protein
MRIIRIYGKPYAVRLASTVRIDSSRNPRCMERQGGRGWGGLVDICGTPPIPKKLKWKHSKKGQSGTIEKRKRKTKGKRQDDHTEVC